MEHSKVKTSLGELINAIDVELKELNIKNEGLRNKLISVMLSDIIDHSYIIRTGSKF